MYAVFTEIQRNGDRISQVRDVALFKYKTRAVNEAWKNFVFHASELGIKESEISSSWLCNCGAEAVFDHIVTRTIEIEHNEPEPAPEPEPEETPEEPVQQSEDIQEPATDEPEPASETEQESEPNENEGNEVPENTEEPVDEPQEPTDDIEVINVDYRMVVTKTNIYETDAPVITCKFGVADEAFEQECSILTVRVIPCQMPMDSAAWRNSLQDDDAVFNDRLIRMMRKY